MKLPQLLLLPTLLLSAITATQKALATEPPDQELGEAVYIRVCASCHGISGVPPEHTKVLDPAPSNLRVGPFLHGDSLEQVSEVVSKGLGNAMFRFDNRLSEEQIAAVSHYILSLRDENTQGGLKLK